jgi:hypothetical protein
VSLCSWCRGSGKQWCVQQEEWPADCEPPHIIPNLRECWSCRGTGHTPTVGPWTQVSNLAAIVRDQEKTIIDLKLRVAKLEALADGRHS